jgi:CPA2 family monovalent cation:H+ antiporter-2
MGDALVAVGGAFLAAGILARMGRRFGLPTIPLFVVGGVLFGPHTPGIVLVEDPHEVELLAAFGLIFLLFHLGLELSLDQLTSGGARVLGAATAYLVLNVGGGILFGLAVGWGVPEALVIGGAMGISSSAIVTKLLTELRRLANPETGLILGIIVVEDLFLALYLALLQPVLSDSQGAAEAAADFAVALAFLVGMAVVARFGGRVVGWLVTSNDDELLTVCFVGLAVMGAGIAAEIGVSEAIGAFMVGLVLASAPSAERIERLTLPLRDAFAALFFFAFGLTIDPGDVGSVALVVVGAVALTLVLNLVAGIIAARAQGFGRNAAARIGLTVLGRGEFSLIIAALAVEAGLDERIGPFVGFYVLVLAVLGPLLATHATTVARLLPERLVPSAGTDRPAVAPAALVPTEEVRP